MRSLRGAAAAALVGTLAACGGRATQLPPTTTELDPKLDCRQVVAEQNFIRKRIKDLEDERRQNTVRTLSRVPGALIGSPLSAIALADPSVAIYREIDAWNARNRQLIRLYTEKDCGAFFRALRDQKAAEKAAAEAMGKAHADDGPAAQ